MSFSMILELCLNVQHYLSRIVCVSCKREHASHGQLFISLFMENIDKTIWAFSLTGFKQKHPEQNFVRRIAAGDTEAAL